jgi:hypothetical protein
MAEQVSFIMVMDCHDSTDTRAIELSINLHSNIIEGRGIDYTNNLSP